MSDEGKKEPWEDLLRTLCVLMFRRDLQSVEISEDLEVRRRVAVVKVRTMIEILPGMVHTVMPNANRETVKRGVDIMKSSAEEVFEVSFTDEDFSN